MRVVLISIIFVCSASTVWADGTVITWDLSKLVGNSYNNHSLVVAGESNPQLTIVTGQFQNKQYSVGSQGSSITKQSTGYTENAEIHIPVNSTSDKITITCHYSCYMDVSCSNDEWDIGSLYEDESYSKTFTSKPDDVKNGYVSITCKKNTSS